MHRTSKVIRYVLLFVIAITAVSICMTLPYLLKVRNVDSNSGNRDAFPDMSFLLRKHMGPIIGPETKHLLNKTNQGKNYLTINFLGGLGNLMFEYASLYGLAVQNHMRPYVPEDSAINQHFNVTKHIGHPLVTSQTRWEPLAEYRPSAFDRNMLSLNYEMNISIVGFLQSWRYFQNVSSDIRKHFQFPKEVQFTAESLLLDAFRAHASKSESRSKQVEYVTYIGVHVRRGDYVSEEYNERRGYTVADIEYLDRAIGYYESRYRNIIFVVCSDDIKWSMFNFRPRNSPVVFSEGHTALEDMAILAACNHTIATVGTFGWWAGWLAGGDVVYYKHFPRPGSVLADHMNKEDYYPKGWVGL